ncbi:MAG: hypothetical protein ACI9F2_000737 [Lysobacterales bacterium]
MWLKNYDISLICNSYRIYSRLLKPLTKVILII